MDNIEAVFGNDLGVADRFDSEGGMKWDRQNVMLSFVEIDVNPNPLFTLEPTTTVKYQAMSPAIGSQVQARGPDMRWYTATLIDASDAFTNGMCMVEWSVGADKLLGDASWFKDLGGGPVRAPLFWKKEMRRHLSTKNRSWGIVTRVIDAKATSDDVAIDTSRILEVTMLAPLPVASHQTFDGPPVLIENMILEDLQFRLSTDRQRVVDSDIYVRNAGNIFVRDPVHDIYHGIENLDAQAEARAAAANASAIARRAILRQQARNEPSGDDPERHAKRAELKKELLQGWNAFTPESAPPLSHKWEVGLFDAKTEQPFTPTKCPYAEDGIKCDVGIERSRHGYKATKVSPRIVTTNGPRVFELLGFKCKCKGHEKHFGPIDEFTCHGVLSDPTTVIVGARAQSSSGPSRVHEVLFTHNANRLGWEDSAVELVRAEWRKSHSLRGIQRALAEAWAGTIMASWPQYVATLSPTENDDEVIGDVIESIRAHLQMHLPSLDSIKKLVLTLTAKIDKPFADALAKVWAGIAGSNSAQDTGHTGTTVISATEKAPDSESADAIGQSVGSMQTERQPDVARHGTTRTLTVELLNVTLLHGTPDGPGRLTPSENHDDFKTKYLNPLHTERTHVHGPNRGTCASYCTDHQNRDGQMYYEKAKEAAPALDAIFGHYMAAFVCDIPHLKRALQEALYAYHLDAGTAKLLLGDCVSRFLHEAPELTPIDIFRLQRMGEALWDTSTIAPPILGEETKADLLRHVADVECPKVDRTLGVYMERVMTSGSLASVPPVAVGIFKKYIKDGLVEALPWRELMCTAARDEVLDHAVTAFALDKKYVYGWVGDVAPPRLLLNRFISTVMGNAEHEVPMRNHLDIAHMVAELGNIVAWGCVERAMTKESANQLKTDIEALMGDTSARHETRSQTASRIEAAARRYQVAKTHYTDVEAMQASSVRGVTSTLKFKTAVRRLVCNIYAPRSRNKLA
jgi:hypothetical protein